jgi:hypothetical protein
MPSRLIQPTFLFPLLLLGNSLLQAQTGGGTFSGKVYDQSGVTIANALVTAKNNATGYESNAHTTSNGDYRLASLPLGNYSLSVSAPGFSKAQLIDLDLARNKNIAINITLSAAESIPVNIVHDSAPPAPKPTSPGSLDDDEMKRINNEIAGYSDRLALSANQQIKIREIFHERQLSIAATREDQSLAPFARRDKINAVRAHAEAEFRAVLNENQLDEYDEILRERQKRQAEKQQAGPH